MNKTIYILEDDLDIGFILKEVLLQEGYLVEVFERVSEIRAALAEGFPGLLLMDVRLPDGNGLLLCAELKSDPAFVTPVLLMSADWHNHDKRTCEADAYIAKPFDIFKLTDTVRRSLPLAG